MFGDKISILDSFMTSHNKIYKKHLALSIRYVREAIATKISGYYLILGRLTYLIFIVSIREMHRSGKHYNLFYFGKAIKLN